MNAGKIFRSILRRYGDTITIRRNGRTDTAKAFVQPLRRRHRLYPGDKILPAGYFDNAYKLYIGDCAHHFDHGDGAIITCMGKRYTVVTSEEYSVGNENVYIWAILAPKKELKEDDYDIIDG